MEAFRSLLVVLFTVMVIYTLIVIANHGLGLFTVFFGDIAAMTWAGQFNVDFMSFLALSATWVAWRHHFSPVGLGLSVVAFFGGAVFLTVYLFIASLRAEGDMQKLLLGEKRAAA